MSEIKPKILIAEDEEVLGQILNDSLASRGFETMHVMEGNHVITAFTNFNPDLILLDINLPGIDGFSLIDKVRSINQEVPVIFLTAKSQTEDVVKGFNKGANDYIKKPFKMEELIVRMNALLQRIRPKNNVIGIQLGDYTFNYIRQELSHPDETINLTARESDLLNYLYKNKNELSSKQSILTELWGDDSVYNGRSLDVFITKLRKYLKHDTSISILNVRGEGYKLVV